MISHWILSALRVFKRQKTLIIINILGLSLGLSSAFIISLYVLNEIRYDRFHKNKDRIYRILTETSFKDWITPMVPFVLSEYIDETIPEVEKTAIIGVLTDVSIKNNGEFFEIRRFRTANDSFFEIFSFNFIEGNTETALNDIHSVVITKSMAEYYFPDEMAVGRTLEVNNGRENFLLTVSGVIEDFPKHSSIRANFIGHIELSLNAFEQQVWSKDIRTTWHLNFFNTYVLLQPNARKESVEDKLRAVVTNFQNDEINNQYSLQPLTDVHLKSSHLRNAGLTGNLNNVFLFSGIGLGILIIACFNYIILSIGQYSSRSKEIGIRKVAGASRKDIIIQFLLESLLMSVVSLIPAIIMVELLLIKINQLFRTDLELNYWSNWWLIGLFISITFIVALFSGGYISIMLSKLNPIKVLKSDKITGTGQIIFQKILITFQIFVFVTLVSSTLVIFKQIQFGSSKNQGFDQNHLASMQISPMANSSNYEAFKYELLQSPYIHRVAGGDVIPPTNDLMAIQVPQKGNPDLIVELEGMGVDFDFVQTLDLEIIQGRDFSLDFLSDSNKIILNETAVKALNLNHPIGELIEGQEVIGVVKDFHLHSLHSALTPIQLQITEAEFIGEYLIRYEPGRFVEARDHCKAVLSKMALDSDFYFQEFSNALEGLYDKEQRLSGITLLFGGFAIFISMLGLFGHSIFAAKRKTHEIGVRKVFGAQSGQILKLFGIDFLILVITANAMSWPVTYAIMTKWLQNFAYQTNIGVLPFLTVFLISVLIVGLTISFHLWKVTMINPTEIFRHE